MKASELRGQARRGRKPGVCPVCGELATHRVLVQVGLKPARGKASTEVVSKSITMCDEHAGNTWLTLAQQVEEVRS